MDITRRTLATGAAWSVPAVAAASAAPVFAASTAAKLTARTATPQTFLVAYSKTFTDCQPSTNPQVGYIDTMCCNSPVNPTNSDCDQDPNTSNGHWIEGDGGTAAIVSITDTIVFNHDVKLDTCPLPGSTRTQAGAVSTWSSCTILNGWTVTQADARTIKVTYSGSGPIATSTTTDGTGFCTGYFLNFHVVDGCYASGGLQRQYTTQWVYSDAIGNNKTWTKSSSWRGI